jgi:methylphosphotriester-DNA--protein-cysteine methyltransferase
MGYANRMKKLLLGLLGLLLIILITGVFAADGSTVVYVTKSGKKYHTATCSSLSRSKIPIELGAAVRSGFTACSRCKPPQLKN